MNFTLRLIRSYDKTIPRYLSEILDLDVTTLRFIEYVIIGLSRERFLIKEISL